MKRGLVFVAAAALVLLLASGAYADTVTIGLQEAGFNGGAITTVGGGSGSAVFVGSYGTFTFNEIASAGTPPLNEPELSTTSIDASTSTAGTLKVYVTEQGVSTVPDVAFLSTFTSQVFNGSIASVTEAAFVDQGNGLFATTTPVGSQGFTGLGTGAAVTGVPGLTAGYSETEVFTIAASGSGNVNDTIVLNQTPEPGTLTLFGSGLLGLAGLLRRKLIRV